MDRVAKMHVSSLPPKSNIYTIPIKITGKFDKICKYIDKYH